MYILRHISEKQNEDYVQQITFAFLMKTPPTQSLISFALSDLKHLTIFMLIFGQCLLSFKHTASLLK